MHDKTLTPCEMEVMAIAWDRNQVSVQDVVDALDRKLAYTTVMTTLKILERKKVITRKCKSGRAFVYEPIVSRLDVARTMAAQLSQHLYKGSMKSFLLSLIDRSSMSKREIEELKRAVTLVARSE